MVSQFQSLVPPRYDYLLLMLGRANGGVNLDRGEVFEAHGFEGGEIIGAPPPAQATMASDPSARLATSALNACRAYTNLPFV